MHTHAALIFTALHDHVDETSCRLFSYVFFPVVIIQWTVPSCADHAAVLGFSGGRVAYMRGNPP